MMRLLILLLIVPLASGLELSSVLPDPDGNDNGKEYVILTGTEDLAGCTVSDDRSSDVLTLIKPGNGTIMIVEEDGIYNDTPDVTVYHAGKAIGNGLGNTADRIAITCDETLVDVAYDVTSMDRYSPGLPILYVDGAWAMTAAEAHPENETIETNVTTPCNTTLAITLGAEEGVEGDTVSFTVVSDGYAAFVAESDGELLLAGDTLTRREYALTLPATDVKLTATAEQCDARQRAVRHIKAVPHPVIVESNASVPLAAAQEPAVADEEPTMNETAEPVIVTGRVVYDEDRSVVPWVSAFGIVTLLVSAWLFARSS